MAEEVQVQYEEEMTLEEANAVERLALNPDYRMWEERLAKVIEFEKNNLLLVPDEDLSVKRAYVRGMCAFFDAMQEVYDQSQAILEQDRRDKKRREARKNKEKI